MVLKDKIAIITGGGRGLGLEIARGFVQEGAKVALAARNEMEIRKSAEELNRGDKRVTAIKADVSNAEDVRVLVKEVIERLGRIDILINNVGINYISNIVLSDDVKWHKVIETNLIGTSLCCKYAIKHMLKQHYGRIVNISSTAAKLGVPFCSAYSASKAGILGLTRSLAVELARENISINAICPGPIEGYLSEHTRGEWVKLFGVSSEEFQKRMREGIPRKKFIRVGDVVKLVIFLSSDLIGDLTGQAINIDGGSTIC